MAALNKSLVQIISNLADTSGNNKTTMDIQSDVWDNLQANSYYEDHNSSFFDDLLYDYYDYEFHEINHITNNVVIVFFGLILLSGVLGNGVVVRVILKDGVTKAVTNLYFLNLAVADLLFLIFCVPQNIGLYIVGHWPFGTVICKLTGYVGTVSMTISVTSLAAMGIDRYHAVQNPIKSRANRTIPKAFLILTVIWVVNLALGFPLLFIYQLILAPEPAPAPEWGRLVYYCNEYFPGPESKQVYVLVIFIIFYTIPLVIIAICYIVMVSSNRLEWRPGSTGAVGRQARSRRRIAKTVAVVVATFAVCWLPIHILQIGAAFYVSESAVFNNILYICKVVAYCMSYSNSAANPFIYAFMSNDFRRAFKETFSCCCCCNDSRYHMKRSSTPSQTNNHVR